MIKLPREFYDRETILVAKDLLGKYLVHHSNGTELIGRIVEVEAYLGEHDLASHSSKGLTKRNKIMFGPPGYAYVYFIYGMHYCMNVVSEREGNGAAILLRAIEPIKNIEGKTNGPALLCQAMNIDKSLNGFDLLSDDFYIAGIPNEKPFTIIERPRIGVGYAKEWSEKLLRFYIEGSPCVSKL
jgi:DNA-3-methyladenine glycosylase